MKRKIIPALLALALTAALAPAAFAASPPAPCYPTAEIGRASCRERV